MLPYTLDILHKNEARLTAGLRDFCVFQKRADEIVDCSAGLSDGFQDALDFFLRLMRVQTLDF
jgi:hypothetical protein